MTDQKQQAFLSRWSSRKQKARDPFTDSAKVPDEDSDNASSTLSHATETLVESDTSITRESTDVASALSSSDTTDASIEQTGTDTAIVQDNSEGEPLLCDDDMPAIDSLAADSDLSAFFNKGVSATLRRAALRHVFQLPQFNIRDGLNDYDGDYTVFEPLGDTVTSDMKWHIARKERERLEAEELARRELEQQGLEQQGLAQQGLEQQELEQQDRELAEVQDSQIDDVNEKATDDQLDHRQVALNNNDTSVSEKPASNTNSEKNTNAHTETSS